jgi:hypothetical protein
MNIVLITLIELERELEYIRKCLEWDELRKSAKCFENAKFILSTNEIEKYLIEANETHEQTDAQFKVVPIISQKGYRLDNLENMIGRNQDFLSNYIRTNYKYLAKDLTEFNYLIQQIKLRIELIKRSKNGIHSDFTKREELLFSVLDDMLIDLLDSLNPAIEHYLGYNSLPIKIHAKLLKVEALIDKNSLSDNIGSIKAYASKYEIEFDENDVKTWTNNWASFGELEDITKMTNTGRRSKLYKTVKDHLRQPYKDRLKALGHNLWD